MLGICQGWLRTLMFLISASQAARITDMSHQCLATIMVLKSPYQLNKDKKMGEISGICLKHTNKKYGRNEIS
jgi:hypothetical protein